MSISRTLNSFLDRERVHYDVLPHPEAFRAAEIAHTLHTPQKEIAKVVIVKVENRFVMTVLPASWNVNWLVTSPGKACASAGLGDFLKDCTACHELKG